jgi:hypothetical protein
MDDRSDVVNFAYEMLIIKRDKAMHDLFNVIVIIPCCRDILPSYGYDREFYNAV